MSARTSKRNAHTDWPRQLRLLFVAAEHECPAGHAAALRELTTLAQKKGPARGIFDPTFRGEHDLFTAIEDIADRHLGMRPAKAAWKRIVREAGLEPDTRDQVEQAAQQLQAVSDTAYFYAGLAFGLTSVSFYHAAP